MAKIKSSRTPFASVRMGFFLLVSARLLVMCAAPADAKEEIPLGLKITPVEAKAAVLKNQVFWVEPSLFIEVSFQGGKVKVPMTKLRRTSFIWENDSARAKLTMSTGDLLEVQLLDREAKLSAALRGMPQEAKVEFPLKSIASIERLEADPVSSTLPPAGTKLFAKAAKGETSPPLVEVGQVNEDGQSVNYSGRQSDMKVEIEGILINCPFGSLKSASVEGEQLTLTLHNGSGISGKGSAQDIEGKFMGMDITIEDWSSVEFSWQTAESISPAAVEGGTTNMEVPWNKRYYMVNALPGRLFVIDEFLTNHSHERSIGSVNAEYRGVKLDVSKGCQSYTFHSKGASAVLSTGEKVPLDIEIEDYCVLLGEYCPSIPARVVISTEDMGEMISGGSAEASTLVKDLSDRVEASSRAAWSITDVRNRTHIVTNLAGYQHGEGYDSAPAGYFYIGGWRTEQALLGGKCAVIDMGKASAHIPLAAIEMFDTTKGLVKLGAEGSDTMERLRGFCSYSSGRDDINNYMRTKEREWEQSVLVGDSALGRLAIPILNCSRIEQILLPPAFAVAPADENPCTIKVQTAEGAQTLKDCLIRYECPDNEFPSSGDDMSRAPCLLALGKDEEDDDDDEYKLAQLAVELPGGPTILMPLCTITSGRMKEDLLEISLTDGKKVLGAPAEGSFLGAGVLGETSIELARTQKFEIER